MPSPILTLDPAFNISQVVSIPSNDLELGDGYTCSSNQGVGYIEQWEISRDGLTDTELNTLLTTLKSYAGYGTFRWKPNDNEPYRIFTSSEFSTTLVAPNIWRFSAIFSVEQSQCVALGANIPETRIATMLEQSFEFIDTYTSNTAPYILRSTSNVIPTYFHNSATRDVPANVGTIYEQLTAIRAASNAYLATGSVAWRSLAESLYIGLRDYYYDLTPPATPTDYFVPQWMLDAKGSYGFADNYPSYALLSGSDRVTTMDSLFMAESTLKLLKTTGSTLTDLDDAIDAATQNAILKSNVVNISVLNKKSNDSDVYSWQGTAFFASETASIARQSGGTFDDFIRIICTAQTPEVNYKFENFLVQSNLDDTSTIALEFGTTGSTNPTLDVTVLNYSFENTVCTRTGTFLYECIDNWTTFFLGSGLLYVTPSGTEFDAYPDGVTCAFVNTDYIGHVTSEIIQANTRYELSVYVGSRIVYPAGNYRLELLADGVQIAVKNATFPGASNGTFIIDTLSYDSPLSGGVVGDTLQIRLHNTTPSTTQVLYDVVTLTKQSLAETSTPAIDVQLYTDEDFSEYRQCSYFPESANTIIDVELGVEDFLDTVNMIWHPTVLATPLTLTTTGDATAESVYENVVFNTYTVVTYKATLDNNTGSAKVTLNGIRNTRIPPKMKLRIQTNSVILRIQDASGFYWDKTLVTTAWAEITNSWDEFDYSTVNVTAQSTGQVPDQSDFIQSIEFVAVTESILSLYWLNESVSPEAFTPDNTVYKHAILSRNPFSHTYYLGDFAATSSALETLPYTTGVVPFKLRKTSSVELYQGIPFIGYQDAGFWARNGYSDRFNNVVDFFVDSQTAWILQNTNGNPGGFAPAYSWGYWQSDEIESNGDFNEWIFTSVVNSANVELAQLHYRAVARLAESWYQGYFTAESKSVVIGFLELIDRYWILASNTNPITAFPPLVDGTSTRADVANAALILKAALYANLAGADSEVTFRLINRAYAYIEGFHVDSVSAPMYGSWAQFEATFSVSSVTYSNYYALDHFEAIDAMALLLRYRDDVTYPSCETILEI